MVVCCSEFVTDPRKLAGVDGVVVDNGDHGSELASDGIGDTYDSGEQLEDQESVLPDLICQEALSAVCAVSIVRRLVAVCSASAGFGRHC